MTFTENKVVFACTRQDLTNAYELDYDQVSSIDPMTPVELGGLLPVGEVIVIFTSGTDSSFRAHTIAIDVDYCQY